MRLVTWNYHGLRNRQVVLALCLLARQINPEILSLLETKMTNIEFDAIRWKLHYKAGLGMS